MRHFIVLKIGLFVLVLFTRCAREIQIDLPDEPEKLVAISHFTPGEPFRVRVTLSRPSYAAGAPEVPENATVAISKNGSLLEQLVFDKNAEYWQGIATPETGVEYSLSVRSDGLPDADASSAVPSHFPLAPVQIDWDKMRIVPWDSTRQALRVPLELKPQQMPETDRFFAFSLRHEIEVFQVVNGQEIPDYSYEGSSTFLTDGRTLSLLHSIPEPVVLIDQKYWDDNRQSIRLDALIPFDPGFEKPRRLLIEWRTLSGEFYRYHLSLARQGDNLPLGDPDAVYNNIVGGYGNFSGYSVTVDAVDLQF